MGGRSDPQGRWEYGRLEVLANGVWIPLDDQSSFDNFGRRGAQVACQTLGYVTGAQLLAGADSVLPSLSSNDSAGIIIVCGGGEDTLADCTVLDLGLDFFIYFNPGNAGQIVDDIALLCTNPSGTARIPCLETFHMMHTSATALHALASPLVFTRKRVNLGDGRCAGSGGRHGRSHIVFLRHVPVL